MQINLSWTDNASNEAGFRIERGTDGSNFALVATVAANVTSFNNTGLTPGMTYFYRVRSVNAAGQSGFAAGNLPTRPAAPTGLAATAGAGQVALAWDAVSGAATYRVYRGLTPGGQGAMPCAGGLLTPAFFDTVVTSGVTYYYRVTAVNVGGESVLSNEASVTPLTPNPPSVQSAVVNGGSSQRSMVTNLQVTFDSLVNQAPGAFVLTDLAGNAIPGVDLQVASGPVSGRTVATITFVGSPIIGGSLADGRYRLRIVAANVTNQAAPYSPMAADATFQFHRFFATSMATPAWISPITGSSQPRTTCNPAKSGSLPASISMPTGESMSPIMANSA